MKGQSQALDGATPPHQTPVTASLQPPDGELRAAGGSVEGGAWAPRPEAARPASTGMLTSSRLGPRETGSARAGGFSDRRGHLPPSVGPGEGPPGQPCKRPQGRAGRQAGAHRLPMEHTLPGQEAVPPRGLCPQRGSPDPGPRARLGSRWRLLSNSKQQGTRPQQAQVQSRAGAHRSGGLS